MKAKDLEIGKLYRSGGHIEAGGSHKQSEPMMYIGERELEKYKKGTRLLGERAVTGYKFLFRGSIFEIDESYVYIFLDEATEDDAESIRSGRG